MASLWQEREKQLLALRERAKRGGGEARMNKQRAAGKLTARERLTLLFDPDTFVEIGELVESRIDDFGMDERRVPGDGVVIGYGRVNGRTVCASSEDFTVIGGTLGEYRSQKICRIMDMAIDMKCPFVLINDSGGARIEEGVASLSGYADIFKRHTAASGLIPQIAVIVGPCAGGACYAPALCDFIFMVQDIGKMFITGPKVVKSVIGEESTPEELGGARIHAEKSGVTHFTFADEPSCFADVRRLLTYLPQNSFEAPPVDKPRPVERSSEIERIVPDNLRRAYDVRAVVGAIFDEDSFLEVQPDFAKNAVIGLARMDGEVVGIVANQPTYIGGSLDCDSSDKMARFIRFCDCFSIPLLTLVDVPAFFPGRDQEHRGIIRHGAKLLYAYSEATVPENHADYAQSLRRRIYRDEQQKHRRGHRLRVADRRNRRHGRGRRGQHSPQAGDRGGGRPAGAHPRADGRIQRKVLQPVYRGAAGFHRRRDSAGRNAGAHPLCAGYAQGQGQTLRQKARQYSHVTAE